MLFVVGEKDRTGLWYAEDGGLGDIGSGGLEKEMDLWVLSAYPHINTQCQNGSLISFVQGMTSLI